MVRLQDISIHASPQQAPILTPMSTGKINSPISIYVVHHPDCQQAEILAKRLFQWFRLNELDDDAAVAGLPVYYRRHLINNSINPAIDWKDADLNFVITLVDYHIVLAPAWRKAIIQLAKEAEQRRDSGCSRVLLLPAALDKSFYSTGPLYRQFNPVRLLDMTDEEMVATLRRAATEAITRNLRAMIQRADDDVCSSIVKDDASFPPTSSETPKLEQPPPLNIFLSHAKRDGIDIAKQLRDGVREFGQLTAWYDANDLPYGANWESPMNAAAEKGTAALVAIVSDAYPTRHWCRREVKLARTPRPVPNQSHPHRIWTMQTSGSCTPT